MSDVIKLNNDQAAKIVPFYSRKVLTQKFQFPLTGEKYELLVETISELLKSLIKFQGTS